MAKPDWIALDPRFLNPLVLWPLNPLGKLPFQPHNHLSREEVLEARAQSWHNETPRPDYFWTPLATYPTGYYGPIFLLGEATTATLGLSPYQATYAYRFWTIALAAALWLIVHRTLRSVPETQPYANLLLAFLLLNPITAFVSSSVTPDAVNIPLGLISVLSTYNVLVHDRSRTTMFVALVACALTKPSGLLVLGSLTGSVIALWLAGCVPVTRVTRTLLDLASLIAITLLAFYLWSPPRFNAGIGLYLGIRGYAWLLLKRIPDIWILYWGRLGWADYQLATVWYCGLAGLLVINLLFLAKNRDTAARQFAMFALLVQIGYIAEMIIGEYRYLPVAGANFQGRHLLPVGLGCASLMLHDARWLRLSLVGYLGLMNVLLVHESVIRYFGGDWHALWLSLP